MSRGNCSRIFCLFHNKCARILALQSMARTGQEDILLV